MQEDDGTFFMEFGEYAASINTVYVCKVTVTPVTVTRHSHAICHSPEPEPEPEP